MYVRMYVCGDVLGYILYMYNIPREEIGSAPPSGCHGNLPGMWVAAHSPCKADNPVLPVMIIK